jgi:galactonate dehydratase
VSARPKPRLPEYVLTSATIARKLGVPIYQLLGGKVRDKIKVYAWIGGDRPQDVAAQA